MVKRKKGEDKLTDDAFKREMDALVSAQEEYKKSQGIDDSQAQNPEFKTGGGLPQHAGPGDSWLTSPSNNDNVHSFYAGLPNQTPNNQYIKENVYSDQSSSYFGGANLSDPSSGFNYAQSDPGFKAGPISAPSFDTVSNPTELTVTPGYAAGKEYATKAEVDDFSAGPNYLGAGLSIGASALSTIALANNAKKRKAELLKNINTPKLQAQQIDLSADRANIRSNQALSESTGRQVAKNARSASEAANIRNMSRIGAQRVGGNQLSQSNQFERSKNADLRFRADEVNAGLSSQDQRQRMMIEQQYGDAPAQLGADFIKSSAQSIQNAGREAEQKRQFYNALNMRNPNYELDFQESYGNLSPRQQLLARMSGGMGVNARKRVR